MTIRDKFFKRFKIAEKQFREYAQQYNQKYKDTGNIIPEEAIEKIMIDTEKQIKSYTMDKLIHIAVTAMMDVNMDKISRQMQQLTPQKTEPETEH